MLEGEESIPSSSGSSSDPSRCCRRFPFLSFSGSPSFGDFALVLLLLLSVPLPLVLRCLSFGFSLSSSLLFPLDLTFSFSRFSLLVFSVLELWAWLEEEMLYSAKCYVSDRATQHIQRGPGRTMMKGTYDPGHHLIRHLPRLTLNQHSLTVQRHH